MIHRSKSIGLLFALLLTLSLILSSCASPATPVASVATEASQPQVEPTVAPIAATAQEMPTEVPTMVPEVKFKAAFIYSSPIGDMGWSYSIDQTRQLVEKELGIETAYVENVKEGSPDAERIIRDFAQKGYNAIFACSGGYKDAMENAAKDFPNTYFAAASGYVATENLGHYVGRTYQARYLAGMVAALMTKTNKLGYVGGMQTADVIVGINAFTLGALSVNPDVKVHVVWVDSWYDPVKEADAANALLEQGADVLTYHANSTSTIKSAAAAGKYAIGYPSDMTSVAPEAVLTSSMYTWEGYFIPIIKEMMAGKWVDKEVYWGIEHGMVGLGPYNDVVPQNVRDQVDAISAKFVDGTFEVWWGPIYGQNGELSIAEGTKLGPKEIRSIDWFVQGVEGTAPGKPPVVNP